MSRVRRRFLVEKRRKPGRAGAGPPNWITCQASARWGGGGSGEGGHDLPWQPARLVPFSMQSKVGGAQTPVMAWPCASWPWLRWLGRRAAWTYRITFRGFGGGLEMRVSYNSPQCWHDLEGTCLGPQSCMCIMFHTAWTSFLVLPLHCWPFFHARAVVSMLGILCLLMSCLKLCIMSQTDGAGRKAGACIAQ